MKNGTVSPLTATRRALERKEARLINAGRFSEAKLCALAIDAVWERENPGASARREAWQAAQIESEARANCFSDGDESTVDHDPRD